MLISELGNKIVYGIFKIIGTSIRGTKKVEKKNINYNFIHHEPLPRY